MTRVPVAVVGAGWFGRKHALALAGIGAAELVGITDVDLDRAERVAAEAGTRAYPDLDAMLRGARPRLVTIATPESLHLEPALTALAAGCDLFVEKPLATSGADARAIADAAARHGRRLAVGHLLRFEESHVQLADRVRAGELGDVRYVYARRNVDGTAFARTGHAHPAQTLMPHDLDLLRWLLGRDPVGVTAYEVPAAGQKLLVAVLEYDGALAVVETCWLLPDGAPLDDALALEVIGTAGTAVLRAPGSAMQLVGHDGAELADGRYWPESGGEVRGALREELRYVVERIADGAPMSRLDVDDALAAVATLERVLASAARRRGSP